MQHTKQIRLQRTNSLPTSHLHHKTQQGIVKHHKQSLVKPVVSVLAKIKL
jgi:hypothetical protein